MLTFMDVNQTLQYYQAALSAAETHGMICGMTCIGTDATGMSGIDTILTLQDVEAEPRVKDLLLSLYMTASQQLAKAELELLLPQDESLAERTQALAQWCQGYLMGMGLAGLKIQQHESDIKQALTHLSEIAKLDNVSADMVANDEQAYQDILHYVSTTAVLLWQRQAENNIANRH